MACKTKADAEKGEKKKEGVTLEAISTNYKEEFGRTDRSYVVFLFKGTRWLTCFTSYFVKMLGSFDLDLLRVDPLENAAYCFKQMFTSFRLRGVSQPEEESIYTEDYMSFLEVLRQLHPEIQKLELLIAGFIDFISSQESLGAKPRLRRMFGLSCLCLDEPRTSFAPVKIGSHWTDDLPSPMFDVFVLNQSYLGYVTHGLDVLTSDSSVARFIPLEQLFGNAGLNVVYSPWDSVDHFGKVQVRENLDPSVASKDVTPNTRVLE